MFEKNYVGIDLSIPELYFLAKELGLNRLMGMGFDFDTISQEAKTTIKNETYNLLNEKKALEMNFLGETTVNPKYAEIAKFVDSPDYCAVIIEKEGDINRIRYMYRIENETVCFDTDENVLITYKFNDNVSADQFMLYGCNVDVSDIEEEYKEFNLKTGEDVINGSSKFVSFNEFIKESEAYKLVSISFSKREDSVWYVVEGDEEKGYTLSQVTEQLRIG